MPLIKSPKKGALESNIKTEMDAHPDKRKQDLAIAFSVQRQARKKKKKMAEGGRVDESAKSESRPMPDNVYNDKKDVSQNSGNKAPKNDDWASNITVNQAQKPSPTKLSQPKLVGSDAFSVRNTDMRYEENDLMDQDYPESDKAQPEKRYDEQNAGGYADGGSVKANRSDISDHKITADSITPEELDMIAEYRKGYAEGGMLPDMEPKDSGIQMRERKDESDLGLYEDPSEDEGASDARSRDEIDQDKSGDPISDNERQHNNGLPAYSKGGEAINPKLQQSKMSLDEEDHPESIADAIRANKKKKVNMAKEPEAIGESDSIFHFPRKKLSSGGILSKDSIDSDSDTDQADVSRNADEDANMEDQSSYNSLRKENYSDSAGLRQIQSASKMDSGQHGDQRERDEEDEHDMVSKIRAKRRFNSI